MQTPFETDLLDDSAAEGFDEEFDEGESMDEESLDALAEGDDDQAFDELDDDSMDDDGMDEEGLDAEGLDDDFEELDADAGAEDFSEEWAEGESFDDSGLDDDALADLFGDAMDEEDDDAFLRRIGARLRQFARSPQLRNILRRTLPIAQRLIRQASPTYGGMIAGGVGQLGRLLTAQSLDAFADVAADYGDDAADEFAPMVAGLTARYAVSSLRRAATRAGARIIGRTVTRAAMSVARNLTRRFGAQALRAVPRIMRAVLPILRRRRLPLRRLPATFRRAAQRVAQRPAAIRRLARPSRVARQLRARAGVRVRRPGAAPARPLGARPRLGRGRRRSWFRPVPGRPGTFDLVGPLRIQVR